MKASHLPLVPHGSRRWKDVIEVCNHGLGIDYQLDSCSLVIPLQYRDHRPHHLYDW